MTLEQRSSEGHALASPDGPGTVLALVRSGRAVTRQALIALTGLSRSTIAQRLDVLLAAGYLATAAPVESSGGRRPGTFCLNAKLGVLLLAATSANGMHVGLADASGTILHSYHEVIDISDGPEKVLAILCASFDRILALLGYGMADVRGIGVGVPGPVAFREGRIVRPPIMPGWDNYRIPDYFAARYDAVVTVDNDANLMALGEHRLHFPKVDHLLYLTVGSGVGSGLIMSGALQRGALGAAGDLGHWFMPPTGGTALPRRCRCGNVGCLEAYTSGWAILRDLQQGGMSTLRDVRDVRTLADRGDPVVLEKLAVAGERLGDALTLAVSLLNPDVIVVGGEIVQEHFLASLRQAVYRRAPPLATRQLQIVTSSLGDTAALHGVAQMMVDTLFDPSVVDRRIGESGQHGAVRP
ncbi:ROK family protein [Robbsia andropogonis]|uniref:ROK family protein n=1 Tax=Robbsia andropogonis TaxID=28092 RepID=UPI002A69C223|nr:ROK family protein [Robbsia andropogonis]